MYKRQQYGNIELIKKNIIKAIGIDKKTYDKYIIELAGANLVSDVYKRQAMRFVILKKTGVS